MSSSDNIESIWEDETLPRFPTLEGDLQTDVLVVGGGIAGLLAAYELQKHGVECVLVERNRICSGVTSKTTAKITAQHRLIYSEIAARYGLERAGMYLSANIRAVEKYAALSHKFKCDYRTVDSYVYSRNRRDVLEHEASVLQQLHYHTDICDSTELPFKTAGALKFPEQGEFHPLKFLGEIAKTLTIYENTHITDIRGDKAFYERGEIHAEKFVIATHFPFIDRIGCYFLKMHQNRSSVLALRNAQKLGGYYVDADSNGLSFRQYGDLLLLGGGAHRTGKPCKADRLVQFAQRAYPKSEIEYSWSTQDCITLDGIPYIGYYGLIKSNLLVATGFNKWGMTLAMAGAEILRDLVLEKENKFAEVFNPRRTVFHKQLMVNGFHAASNLAAPKKPRCAHMGCALEYNSAEHSWDCPCHGSRYSESGTLLEGPANHDLNSTKASNPRN
ncbi:MAG: FAD-dependent oxidoreductase [Oscillospiraceae bacterium]